jgi:hypothetical protein
VFGFLAYRNRKVVFTLLLHSASGESQALHTKNEAFAREVEAAIREAIVDRG